MKIFVTHNKQGKIKSIGVPASDSKGTMGLKSQRGQIVSEVEASDSVSIKDFQNGEELNYKLRDLAEQFHVDSTSGKPRLVRLNTSKKKR
jgi:hypothetical protein